MNPIANPTSDVGADAAVAVTAKQHDQKKVEGQNAVKLIESANPEPKPLPQDSTYSTYA